MFVCVFLIFFVEWINKIFFLIVKIVSLGSFGCCLERLDVYCDSLLFVNDIELWCNFCDWWWIGCGEWFLLGVVVVKGSVFCFC